MSVQMLGVVYLAIGAGLALVVTVVRGVSALDAALVTGLWPMYAPFVLFGGGGHPTDAREAALAAALAQAAQSPLASALPNPDASRELGRRLHRATCRLAELDVLVARPDMAPERLAPRAAAAIHQLIVLRDRYRTALDDIVELVRQLTTQVELVRVQPDLVPSSVELVYDLVARVDGLAELGERE
jgi:hypothetical protein